MKARQLSLAGQIESDWIKSGRPRLSWDDLLKRAIIADIQLEQLGLNPAKRFRVLRLARNSSRMFEYIAGYHQYDFCPSYSDVVRNDRPPRNDFSASVKTRRSDIGTLYRKLRSEHPHHLLPLETFLPEELKFRSRDQYRIIMTMILSQRTGDLQLINCLVKLFSSYPDLESLKPLTETRLQAILSDAGFGFHDPRKQGNGARLWSLKEQYFGPWGGKVTEAQVQELASLRIRGFGLKFIKALQAYCFGNEKAFPLDGPAFRCLQEAGLYKGLQLDEARRDVEAKLSDQDEVHAIDFHELLRFRGQAGIVKSGILDQSQQRVITGWNGWRVLSSNYRNDFSRKWIYEKLVKNEEIAKCLLRFCK